MYEPENENINSENNYEPEFNTVQNNQQPPIEQQFNDYGNNQPYTSVYKDGYTSYQYQPAVTEQKKKKKEIKVFPLILACAVISAACGFGGSVLANKMAQKNGTTGTVIKQAIVNSSNSGAKDYSISDIVAACENSVVEISTETVQRNAFMQQYISEGAGSGVIISADGYIITNNHVIANSTKISVRLKSGKSYEGKLIGTDEESDVAVVKIEATELNAATFGNSDKLVVGELSIAIGNPLGTLGGTVTDGIISALDREIDVGGSKMTLLQTNAAVNPGNSGGGLFNAKGELIGIVNSKTSSSGIEGLGFAIPINTASKVAADLIENGYVTGRPTIDVQLVEVNDVFSAFQYGVSETGLYVAKVGVGSAADIAGLKSGDRIVSMNGTEIYSESDFNSVLKKCTVGETVSLIVSRDGKAETVKVKISEKKNSITN